MANSESWFLRTASLIVFILYCSLLPTLLKEMALEDWELSKGQKLQHTTWIWMQDCHVVLLSYQSHWTLKFSNAFYIIKYLNR